MSKSAYFLGVLCLVELSIIVYLLFPKKQPLISGTQKPIEIPQSINVPEPRSSPAAKGLAIPKTVVDAIAGSTSKVRTFDIIANANEFSSDKIAVYQNDIIRINVTALDKPYDFTIDKLGLSQHLNPGESKSLEFQALTPGSYTYTCITCAKNKTNFETTQPIPKGVLLIIGR